jgi:hypothetical protein
MVEKIELAPAVAVGAVVLLLAEPVPPAPHVTVKLVFFEKIDVAVL